MTSKHPRRPRGRGDWTQPHEAAAEHYLGDDEAEIDLEAVYEEVVGEVGADWLDRYGEENWYAAITLFGLFSCGGDIALEDIPEEYRWKGKSHRYPTASESQPTEDGQ